MGFSLHYFISLPSFPSSCIFWGRPALTLPPSHSGPSNHATGCMLRQHCVAPKHRPFALTRPKCLPVNPALHPMRSPVYASVLLVCLSLYHPCTALPSSVPAGPGLCANPSPVHAVPCTLLLRAHCMVLDLHCKQGTPLICCKGAKNTWVQGALQRASCRCRCRSSATTTASRCRCRCQCCRWVRPWCVGWSPASAVPSAPPRRAQTSTCPRGGNRGGTCRAWSCRRGARDGAPRAARRWHRAVELEGRAPAQARAPLPPRLAQAWCQTARSGLHQLSSPIGGARLEVGRQHKPPGHCEAQHARGSVPAAGSAQLQQAHMSAGCAPRAPSARACRTSSRTRSRTCR